MTIHQFGYQQVASEVHIYFVITSQHFVIVRLIRFRLCPLLLVYFLHFRLDPSPKYYTYAPFASDDS